MTTERIKLPQELEHRYVRLNLKFDSADWKAYNDQIIPEDKEYAKEIVSFLIDLIDFICKNFEKLDKNAHIEFLGNYYYKFYYGPHGDDSNYLDFDETTEEGKSVYEIFTEIWQIQEKPAKAKLLKIKEQFCSLLKRFD
ncbi:hypothetical protein HYU16_03175 [Candidatus Woesearchaeota archaeon]|nr:hypothetical protein [Candidatus Woesearchaeota archaeon]